MEALILSCSTGGGHNSAAQAVADEMLRRGHQITFMDPYDLAGKNTAKIIGSAYVKLVQKAPKVFGVVYALAEAYRHIPIHSPVYWANAKMATCIQNYLNEHHYDVIIMSHIFPTHILTYLKEQQTYLPTTVLIATDYTCIPFSEETDCDYYIIPSEELRKDFCAKGIPDEKILPFGIPIRQEFIEPNIKEAKKRLGLSPERKIILLSGGSIGAGNITDAVEILLTYMKSKPEYDLIVICGNNERLYYSLRERYERSKRIRILQSTTQMSDYLSASTVFISKPGGLSSTEAAASQAPLLHISPIPGCETRNAMFFSSEV